MKRNLKKQKDATQKTKKHIGFATVIKILCGILLSLTIMILVVLRVFVVKDVTIKGNKLYEPSVIEAVVFNDEYSWNSLYVFLKYRFMETETIAFVDTMEITLESPTSLCITVYEKGLVGYIHQEALGRNVYFDKDGVVAEISERLIPDISQIQGLECDEVVQYEKLSIKRIRIRELLALTQALKRKNRVPEIIRYGGPEEPEIVYGTITVQMGDIRLLTQKVERLDKILPSLKGKTGVLHLENWTEDSKNIVFSNKEKANVKKK